MLLNTLLLTVSLAVIGNSYKPPYPLPLIRRHYIETDDSNNNNNEFSTGQSGSGDTVPGTGLSGQLSVKSGNLTGSLDDSSNRGSDGSSGSVNPRVSVAIPNSCDNIPAGADKVPFSCYDQNKLKDYCSKTFGQGTADTGKGTSGNKKYVIYTSIKANWFQALTLCQSRNMSLATVESPEEQTALSAVLNQAVGVQNAWLSATDLGQLGQYIWLTTGQRVAWTNWYNMEPNHLTHGNETERCVEAINYRWRWNDNVCSNEENFVCQYYSDS